jgi:hypothetical protein
MNSKVDANLLAYLKLAQELFRKKIMHHFHHYLAEAARKKAIVAECCYTWRWLVKFFFIFFCFKIPP